MINSMNCVNTYCLYARNIEELREFNSSNEQPLCPQLAELDQREDEMQAAEIDARENDVSQKRWNALISIGQGIAVGVLVGGVVGVGVVGLNMWLTGKKYNKETDERTIAVIALAGGGAGVIYQMATLPEYINFERARLDRLQAKINTISRRMELGNEQVSTIEMHQLDIAKTYFVRLMSHDKIQLVKHMKG